MSFQKPREKSNSFLLRCGGLCCNCSAWESRPREPQLNKQDKQKEKETRGSSRKNNGIPVRLNNKLIILSHFCFSCLLTFCKSSRLLCTGNDTKNFSLRLAAMMVSNLGCFFLLFLRPVLSCSSSCVPRRPYMQDPLIGRLPVTPWTVSVAGGGAGIDQTFSRRQREGQELADPPPRGGSQ